MSSCLTTAVRKWAQVGRYVLSSASRNLPRTRSRTHPCSAFSRRFDKGQIIFGGLAPFPEAGAVGHFGILGGTDAFRKARGDATLVVLSNGDSDTILDLE